MPVWNSPSPNPLSIVCLMIQFWAQLTPGPRIWWLWAIVEMKVVRALLIADPWRGQQGGDRSRHIAAHTSSSSRCGLLQGCLCWPPMGRRDGGLWHLQQSLWWCSKKSYEVVRVFQFNFSAETFWRFVKPHSVPFLIELWWNFLWQHQWIKWITPHECVHSNSHHSC